MYRKQKVIFKRCWKCSRLRRLERLVFFDTSFHRSNGKYSKYVRVITFNNSDKRNETKWRWDKKNFFPIQNPGNTWFFFHSRRAYSGELYGSTAKTYEYRTERWFIVCTVKIKYLDAFLFFFFFTFLPLAFVPYDLHAFAFVCSATLRRYHKACVHERFRRPIARPFEHSGSFGTSSKGCDESACTSVGSRARQWEKPITIICAAVRTMRIALLVYKLYIQCIRPGVHQISLSIISRLIN